MFTKDDYKMLYFNAIRQYTKIKRTGNHEEINELLDKIYHYGALCGRDFVGER